MLDKLDSKCRRKYRMAWVFKKTYLTERARLEKELSGHADWFDENEAGKLEKWRILINKEYPEIHHFIQIKKEDSITGETIELSSYGEIYN